MARENQEQPDVPPFEYRAGVTMPAIGGMYRRGDPSQIPPHRLHLGVNIRLADGETGDRPGLALVTGTTEDACITGIFEIEDFAVGLYITKFATVAPFAIMAFNEEKTPPELDFWDETATFAHVEPGPWRAVSQERDCFNTFQPFNDTLLIINGGDVYQAEFSEDEDNPRLDLSKLFSLPASAPIYSSCTRRERVDDPQTGDEFEKDVLYLGGADGDVWRYDGTTRELVHTLAGGGPMQIIRYNGTGLVAAGDDGVGFTYQQQPGFAWVDQVWGTTFECHGLCEFNQQVVFVGGTTTGPTGDAKALRWPGSGAPISFASDTQPGLQIRYRTPVVSGGALHWIKVATEDGVQADYFIARFTDFTTGSDEWAKLNSGSFNASYSDAVGFFIPYAGVMALLVRFAGPAAAWPSGDNIVLATSGAVVNFDPIYNWASPQVGSGFEAIPL